MKRYQKLLNHYYQNYKAFCSRRDILASQDSLFKRQSLAGVSFSSQKYQDLVKIEKEKLDMSLFFSEFKKATDRVDIAKHLERLKSITIDVDSAKVELLIVLSRTQGEEVFTQVLDTIGNKKLLTQGVLNHILISAVRFENINLTKHVLNYLDNENLLDSTKDIMWNKYKISYLTLASLTENNHLIEVLTPHYSKDIYIQDAISNCFYESKWKSLEFFVIEKEYVVHVNEDMKNDRQFMSLLEVKKLSEKITKQCKQLELPLSHGLKI